MEWGIGKVSEKIIDRINILEATKLAMKKAIQQLKRKPDFLILDGNFKINSSIPQRSIIKADEKVFSCAAASILAKVTRDRIMERFDKKYPQYGFGQHKGYPTKLHVKMLKKIIRETAHCCVFMSGAITKERGGKELAEINKFKKEFQVVNLAEILKLKDVTSVDPRFLKEQNLIKKEQGLVKILGRGEEVKKPLTIKAHAFSSSAKEKIEKAGGTVEIIS